MKNKKEQKIKTVKVPEAGLLSLVAAMLKDRVLFPEKLADAREHLRKMQVVKR